MAKARFDEEIAARYDETSVHMYRPEVLDPAVDFLEELAGDGAALEFGVGTGRVRARRARARHRRLRADARTAP